MEQLSHKAKKYLLAGILLFLLLPFAQQVLKFHNEKPLRGYINPIEKPFFNMHDWWSGDYQLKYEEWHNANFGLRSDLVRVHNQIAFMLYNKAKANGVIIGKENYLYELFYIRAYTGKDYVGKSSVMQTAQQLKQLQDSLEAKGTTLIVCLAPGKASYYPEYIPDEYGPASDSTNYKVMSAEFNRLGVNLIDYNKWFLELKKTSEHPLFPKTGIHWSRNSSLLAFDSLVHYVERKRGVDMPEIVIERTEVRDSMESPDDDIGEAMNLLWPIKTQPLPYPVYHFGDTTGKAHVSMMTISDSYFWNMFDRGITPSPFERVDFYYYFKEHHFSPVQTMEAVSEQAGVLDAEKHDVVVIMSTEANLFGIGWGFIGSAFNHYVLHKLSQPLDQRVKDFENAIRMDEKWLNAVKEKAVEEGVPLDTMIRRDAIYMAEEERKAKK
jgi:hypothetical protein